MLQKIVKILMIMTRVRIIVEIMRKKGWEWV